VEVPERLPQRLPQGHEAVVKRDKTLRYMLDPRHPDGGAKARRWEAVLGYRREHFERLREDLRAAAVNGTVRGCRLARPAGLTWTVDITITGPNGATAGVRSLWHALAPGAAPRLTSAWVDRAGPPET
jgi:filamentous hemagglutinin